MPNNNSKVNTILLVILILAVAFCAWKLVNNGKEVKNNASIPTGQTQTNQNPNGQDFYPYQNSPTEDLYLDQANTAFVKWMTEQGGFSDYKIEKITFIASKSPAQAESSQYFSSSDTQDAFIVSVDFSVKPTAGNTMWNAGNGHQQADGWVTNKSLFLTIDKNSSGYFVKSSGTGL